MVVRRIGVAPVASPRPVRFTKRIGVRLASGPRVLGFGAYLST
jgi:hypothetical protein